MSNRAARAIPSVIRGVFGGRLSTGAIHPYPYVLNDDTKSLLQMVVDPVEKFFENVNDAAANDENEQVDPAVTEQLKEMGAFGLQVPEEYSGMGLNNTGYARLVEIVGAHDLGMGIFLGAHQSIGFKGITLFGTPEQKEKYLPDLATGKKIAAFCLTEPSSGSDANSIRTKAELSSDGSHWVLNGGKLWISNGGIADVFTVFAQTPVKDEKTGETKNKVTAFVVERGFGGVTNGPPEKKMGIKCSNTAEVHFDNVKVPKENVLGEVGKGFHVAMQILNNGRFGMGAALSGTMKACIKGAAAHAIQRKQFNHTLKEFGLIKGKFASMAMKLYATESMAYMVAGNMDRGAEDYQLEAAASKIFASEAAWFVADEAIQVMGGLGFMKEYPYERVMRDLRIFRIFEGTNDILRLFIALTGLQSLGEEMKPLQKAMKNPLGNLGTVLPAAVSIARGKLNIPEKPTLDWTPSQLRSAGSRIEEATALFGTAAKELLMQHGKGVIDPKNQLVLERLSDAAIHIFAMLASTARATRSDSLRLSSAEHELLLADAITMEYLEKVQQDLAKVRGSAKDLYRTKHEIADQLFEFEGYKPEHPLGF